MRYVLGVVKFLFDKMSIDLDVFDSVVLHYIVDDIYG